MKRRWCVLEGSRLSFFHSRTKRKAKGYIDLVQGEVVLACPPYFALDSLLDGMGPENVPETTTDKDTIALVSARLPPESGVLAIRAESMAAHLRWIKALKARFVPRDLAESLEHFDRLQEVVDVHKEAMGSEPDPATQTWLLERYSEYGFQRKKLAEFLAAAAASTSPPS